MRALVIVDVQNDFIPGGSLAVGAGDQVIPVLNRVSGAFDLVVATQDWHPAAHGSFARNHAGRAPGQVIDLHGLPQVLWPAHCVQGTPGADFAPGLDLRRAEAIFRKGTDPTIDSYSAFFDNGQRKATGLGDYLRGRGVTSVAFGGLATDYCVKASVLDARRLGFEAQVIEDACRAVDLRAGDGAAALAEMERAGARVITSGELSRSGGEAGNERGR